MTTEDQEKTGTTVTFITPVDMHKEFRDLLDLYNLKNPIKRRTATSIFLVAMRDAIKIMEKNQPLPN